MKRMMILSVLLSSTLIATAATIKPTGMVTDTVPILSMSERSDIENLLQTYKQRTTNEIAVLIVKSLDGQDIKQYANTVFHDWGIGVKGKNNGILFLWSTGDRKMRFEVGYGLEGALPDGRAGQIIRENITPQFRSSKWFDGLKGGLTAVIKQIDSQTVPVPVPTPVAQAEQSSAISNSTILVLLLGLGTLIPISFAVFLFIRKVREDNAEETEVGYTDPEMSIRSRGERVYYPNPVEPQRYYSRASTKKQEDSSYTPPVVPVVYEAPSYSSPSSSSSDSSSSSSSSSDFGGFSGGDSGGGGADGSY